MRKGTKAIMIGGAIRIGKSTIAEEFGKNEYQSYIMIDFNKSPKRIKALFDELNNLDIFFNRSHWSITLDCIKERA